MLDEHWPWKSPLGKLSRLGSQERTPPRSCPFPRVSLLGLSTVVHPARGKEGTSSCLGQMPLPVPGTTPWAQGQSPPIHTHFLWFLPAALKPPWASSLALSLFLSRLSWKSCLLSVSLPCHCFTPCGLAPCCPHPRDFPRQGPRGLCDPDSLRCLT